MLTWPSEVDVDRPQRPRIGRRPDRGSPSHSRLETLRPPAPPRRRPSTNCSRQPRRAPRGRVDRGSTGWPSRRGRRCSPAIDMRRSAHRPPTPPHQVREVEPLAPAGRAVDVDHRTAHHPGGGGVVDAAVGGVVVADVLQVAGAGVEPQPPRRVGVGQAHPPPRPEHPSARSAAAPSVRRARRPCLRIRRQAAARTSPCVRADVDAPHRSPRRPTAAADPGIDRRTTPWPMPALDRPTCSPTVAAALRATGARRRPRGAIDPELADTAAFCDAYGVHARRVGQLRGRWRPSGRARHPAGRVRRPRHHPGRRERRGPPDPRTPARRRSRRWTSRSAETGMEYGGITPIGLPADWPVLVDAAVAAAADVVIGSGLRRSKLLVPGALVGRPARRRGARRPGAPAAVT